MRNYLYPFYTLTVVLAIVRITKNCNIFDTILGFIEHGIDSIKPIEELCRILNIHINTTINSNFSLIVEKQLN